MNTLDYQKRTRIFFRKLRKKFKQTEFVGSIRDRFGTLSNNSNDIPRNWSDFYRNLYFSENTAIEFPTPDEDPLLDCDLSHSEFLDVTYSLKHYKAPGYDYILNGDIISLTMEESKEDPIASSHKIKSFTIYFGYPLRLLVY